MGRGAWGWSGMGDVSWGGCSGGRVPARNRAGLGTVVGSGNPVWLHGTLSFFWSAFTLAVFFQGHLPQLTAWVPDHQDLHSDLVLPSGHTLQAVVRAAATTALHSHAAGHQLLGYSAHELHGQRHHRDRGVQEPDRAV